jgi:hypothetical protein
MALLAIEGGNYRVAGPLQPPRKHVAIHFVIFDQ